MENAGLYEALIQIFPFLWDIVSRTFRTCSAHEIPNTSILHLRPTTYEHSSGLYVLTNSLPMHTMAQLFSAASQKIRSRPKPITLPEEVESHSERFPIYHQLVVTTERGIFVWTRDSFKEIFRSSTGGIVAAKKLSHSSNLLAVADSQIVVLHDINRGQQHSHKLKGSEVGEDVHTSRDMLIMHEQGQIRLLKYQEDSTNLYFTTSLQHAVQRYSLHTAKLLEPSYAHPSPPTVFAISVSSHLLLSASASPPITHLTNILVNERPLLIKPFASSSAVVVAAFHPSEDTIFVLGFADGTVAAYDAKHMFYDRGPGKRRINVFDYCSAGEISHIRNLHVVTTATSCSDPGRASFFCGYDNGTKTTAVGDLAQSITALTFVPGFACVVVTVGADGRCCVVDFGLGTVNRAEVVHAWHIRGSATSISALSMSPDFPWHQVDDLDGQSKTSTEVLTISPLVAVGRQDGTVLLFDLEGNLQEQHTFGTEGARIIDVEWLTNPNEEHKEDLRVREKRHIVSIINGKFTDPAKKRRPVYQSLPRTSVVPQKLSVSSSSRVPVSLPSAGPTSVQAQSSRSRADSMSTLKMTADYSEPSNLRVSHVANLSHRPSLGTVSIKESESLSKENGSPPKIPPRPVPRKGGKLAQRRAERANIAKDATTCRPGEQEQQTSDQIDGPTPPSEVAQRMSDPKPKDLVTPESGPKKGKPKMPSKPRKASARKASTTIRTSDTKASVVSPPEKRPVSTQASTVAPTEHSNDTVIDWIANYGAPESKIIRKPPASIVHPTAPLSPLPPAHTPPLPPPSTSTLPQSIASDDTIIDWHTLKKAPTRPLNLLNTINHTPHDSIAVTATTQTRSFEPYPQRPHPIGPQPHTATTPSVISPRASIGTVPQPQHPTFHHPQPCPCIQDNIILHKDLAELQKSVGQELRTLKEAVKASLRRQKKWVETQMGISEEGMRALEEENRRLRGELGKLAKSKGGNRG